MLSAENKAFWAKILKFLKENGGTTTQKLATLRLFALTGDTSLLSPDDAKQLPVDDEHDHRWRMLNNFFHHPEVQQWDEELILNQLTLVAEGRRGAELHDNCIELPLFN